MTGPILRLTTEDVTRLTHTIDPLNVLLAQLAGRDPGGRLRPWPLIPSAAGAPAEGLVVLEDHVVGGRCVLPSDALGVVRTAAMGALAARVLTAPGVVTAAVLGVGLLPRISLTLVERNLSGLSHVAICPAGRELDRPVPRAVTDPLDRAGVAWTVRTAVAESVFGATLVIAAAVTIGWRAVRRLPLGATVINMTGHDLPDALVQGFDHVFVDDLALVVPSAHRYFARTRLLGADRSGAASGNRLGRHGRGVCADLAQLLGGTHTGRTHADDVLLVELLGTGVLDAGLAGTLHRSALERGLGRTQ